MGRVLSPTAAGRYNATMPQPDQILIFLPNPVGDAVMATPALRAIRRKFASARITHLGRAQALETLRGCNLADACLADISTKPPRTVNFTRMVRRVRKGRFNLAVLFPNSFRSALLACWGGASRIVGYARGARGWMLTDRLEASKDDRGRFRPIPQIDYYLALAERLGAEADSRRMTLGVTSADEAQADEMLRSAGADDNQPLVMLNPGAAFGPSKMWDPLRYAAVADALVDSRGAQIIINAAPNEQAAAAQVAAGMKHTPLLNFAELHNTIGLLKGLIRRCSVLITNDTGARHFAAAFGIGVVTLFGSTAPTWARIDYPRERIIRVSVPCSPCQKKLCPNPPGSEHHQCMTAITPEMVIAAAEELLDVPADVAGEVAP